MDFAAILKAAPGTPFRKCLIAFMCLEIQKGTYAALKQSPQLDMDDYDAAKWVYGTFSKTNAIRLFDKGPKGADGVLNYLIKHDVIRQHHFGEKIERKPNCPFAVKTKVNRSLKWKLNKALLNYQFSQHIDYSSDDVCQKIAKFKDAKIVTALGAGFEHVMRESVYGFDKRFEDFKTIPKPVKRGCINAHFDKHPSKARTLRAVIECLKYLRGCCRRIREWNAMDMTDRFRKYSSKEYHLNKQTRITSIFASCPAPYRNFLVSSKAGKGQAFLDLDIVCCHPALLAKLILDDVGAQKQNCNDWTYIKVIRSGQDLYDHIAGKLEMSRAEAKELFNSFINSPSGAPVHKEIAKVFPDLEAFVAKIKLNKTLQERFIEKHTGLKLKTRSHKFLGDILRSMEAQLVWEKWVNHYPFLQIVVHDGIMISLEFPGEIQRICLAFRKFIKHEIGDFAEVKIKTICGTHNLQTEFRKMIRGFAKRFNVLPLVDKIKKRYPGKTIIKDVKLTFQEDSDGKFFLCANDGLVNFHEELNDDRDEAIRVCKLVYSVFEGMLQPVSKANRGTK